MADQLGERPRPLPLAVAADLRHRDLECCRRASTAARRRRRRRPTHARPGRPPSSRPDRPSRKQASDCGRSMQKKWIFCRTPPITPTASPKSTCAWPGGCDSGTNVSRPRARGDPDIILHHRVAAGEAMLVAQPLEDPLRRMPLLHRRQSGPPPGSRRSPAAAGPASASPPASCACSPAAARTGTSSTPSRGSARIPAPPHDGCCPRRTRNAGQRRRLPRQTSRPTPKRDQPNHWTDFTPPAPHPRRRSSGLLCHRPAHLRLGPLQLARARPLPGLCLVRGRHEELRHLKIIPNAFGPSTSSRCSS